MAWRGFLAARLFPAATRLHAHFEDSVESVLARIPADATHFLFHISATITTAFTSSRADLLAALGARGIRTINASLTDISKPAIQRQCAELSLPVALAARTLPADTPVIVKKSLNFAGKTEKYLPQSELARLGMHLAHHVPDPENYRIMPAGDVPQPWWDDPALCIERYISNDEGRYHRALLWQDRLAVLEAINPHPIKKAAGNASSHWLRFRLVDGRYRPADGSRADLEPLLAQVAAYARATGLRFGAIDTVLSNSGEYYLIDVNTTPFTRPIHEEIYDHLGGA